MSRKQAPTVRRRPPAAQTQRRHRGLAVSFGALSVIFLTLILYFAFARTVVSLTPRSQPVTVIFPLSVRGTPPESEGAETIVGRLVTTIATAEATLQPLPTTETITGTSRGTVTITNTWGRSQPLAATTRLLSADGVLFRTDQFVEVPANGQAAVSVTADQPGQTGDIGPSRFSIPGLSRELQERIYGESNGSMTGGTVTRAVVTETDIATVRKQLEEKLMSEARSAVEEKLNSIETTVATDTIKLFTTPGEEMLSAQLGQPAETVTATTSATIVGLAYNQTDLFTVIINKLLAQLPSGETLEEFDEGNFSLTLESYDRESQIASLQVTAQGMSTIDLADPTYAPERVTNKSRAEIISYFASLSSVESGLVEFSPFWVVRSPTVAKHITITLKH